MTRSNTIPPRTLQHALTAAHKLGLEPWLSDAGNFLGMTCPICRNLDTPATAYIVLKDGILIPECAGCNNDVDPGILETLGAITHTTDPDQNGKNTPDPSQLSWIPLDVVTLGDTPRVPPAICGLIYPGRKHILWGESESGKSWCAISCAADEILAGYGVVWVDIDYMGAQDILERLRQLNVPDDVIRDRFAFYQPEGALEGYSLDGVLALIKSTNARLVIIDAFTGFCAIHQLNPEKTIDIEKAYHLMNPLCAAGAGVVILDHVVKNADNRGTYAIGAERKKSGADVAIGFTLLAHYGRGATGKARLIVHKDRPAMLKRPVVGIFTLRSHPETHMVKWSLEADASKTEDGTWRPTGYMERISKYLERFTSPISRTEIIDNVTGKGEHLRKALDALVAEGYTMEVEGERKALMVTLLNAFREDDQ